MDYLRETALIAAAYTLGCVSTGYYLVRFRMGEDVRRLGSGTAGARNVGRLLGRRALALTLAADALKGALPVTAAYALDLESWAALAVVLAVVAGHMWPAQLGFHGGKGLATTMGAVAVLDYRLVLAAFAIAGVAWLVSRNSTAGALGAVALTPAVAALAGHPPFAVMTLAILAALILLAHRANLQSIFANDAAPSSEGA